MKRIDVGEIGEGNLINFVEVLQSEGAGEINKIVEMKSGHKAIADNYFKYGTMSNNRYVAPLVGHWIFNDGSMVLPDGLVVEVRCLAQYEGAIVDDLELLVTRHSGGLDKFDKQIDCWVDGTGGQHIIAVKILGVTAEYGAQLGMEVINL